MQILTYTVRIEPAEEGGYDVYCAGAAGLRHPWVTPIEEAVAMAQEAIDGPRRGADTGPWQLEMQA